MAVDARMKVFTTAIGTWLREARLKQGLTLLEAARELNVSKREIKEIEAGDRNIAGSDFHSLIAAYKIPVPEANAFLADFGLQIAAE